MAIVPGKTTYEQTVVTTPTVPTAEPFDLQIMAPFIREIVATGTVEEPKINADLTAAKSFFNGNGLLKLNELNANIKFGQEYKVIVEKDQNPLSLFVKDDIGYVAIDECHDQIELDCAVPCINTKPEFEYITLRFDTEYAYGVRMCDKNKEFWDVNLFTKQYALSRQAMQFGEELDFWNKVIKGLIAAPATTVDAKLAVAHPTHFWDDLGTLTAAARLTIPMAYWYLVNNYKVNPTVFMPAEAATEIIRAVENPYNLNLTTQRVNTFEQWDVPGFMVADAAREILGLPAGVNVVIMKRSAWLTTAGQGAYAGDFTTQYPLWNEDTTKQYVALLDPRVGYFVERDGYHLTINPYDCDKLIRGMVDTVYTASGITFAQFGLVMEFDGFVYTPANA